MSKLTDIKSKINQLGGGEFQEFCDQYLSHKGYDEIFELGMQSGTMKTTIGNPDTYFKSKSGKYIFVAYTTQQENINVKIEEDIKKCLNKNKTGVNICDIEEIICCHTSSTLNAGKDKELHDMCKKKGVLLELYGIDRIANDIYQHYPILAKRLLGISIDTNQISNVNEFISRYDSNEMAASLETNFQFRDNELKDILKAIETNKIAVVFGKPGVGKTRIAIEACRIFSEQNTYKLLCIRSYDLPIYEDLISYIPTPGKYLIFIDDANELIGFKHVLQYINMSNKGYDVKIIITVRDYAKKYIIDQVNEFNVPKIIEINKFSDEEIKKFLGENLNINNDLYLDQIARIAEGNPRIAYLAGKLAKTNQNLKSIQDVSQLFDIYYNKYINKSVISTNSKVCLSAGIIALLHTINLSYLDKLQPVFELFDMNKSEFIDNLRLLHNMEFIDIHYDKIVQISDQCLSNYMIYYTFFERRLIPFSKILDIGFKNFRKGIIQAINILLNVFYSKESKEYIEKQVGLVWDKYKKENEELYFDFIKIFHDFRPNESLIYVQQKIECMPEKKVDVQTINFDMSSNRIDDDILILLAGYRYSNYIYEALELMIEYCKKRQDIIVQAAYTIATYFSVDRYSYGNEYYTLRNAAKVISKHCNDNQLMQNLFINVSGKLLLLNFSSTEELGKNNIRFYSIPIYLTEGSKEYRSCLWNQLIILSNNMQYKNKIIKIIDKYSQGWIDKIDSKVLGFDLPFIEDLIKNINDVRTIRVAHVCKQLIKKYKHYSILIGNDFENIFKNQEWDIYSMLSERCYDNYSYDERESKRKNNIIKYAQSYGESNFNGFLKSCNNIIKELPQEEWTINEGLSIFCNALENNRSKYLAFINSYFNFGENLNIYPEAIIIKLFEYLGVDKTFSFISDNKFIQKNEWLFTFFEVLPENEITNKWVEEFLKFLKKDDDKNVKKSSFIKLRFLDKYIKLRPQIYIDAVTIINEKFKYNPFIAQIYLELLFNENVYKPSELIKIFKDNIPLLQDIYFKMLNCNSDEDYSGHFIQAFIENDKSWLSLYTQYIINDKNSIRNYEFDRINACWLSNDYLNIFDYIFYQIENDDERYKWRLEKFFENLLLHQKNEQDIANNQINWLKHIIFDNCKDKKIIDIFKLISELGDNTRKECIIYFINLNKDFELFKKLDLEPNHWGGAGSMIPYMEQRIKFYESLLPYFTGLELLKHKELLLENIDMWRHRIENEQIEEIIEDRVY